MNSRTLIPWAGWRWWWRVDFMNTPSLAGGGGGLHEHSFLGGGGGGMNTPSLGVVGWGWV